MLHIMDLKNMCRSCMKIKDKMRSLFEPMNVTTYANLLLSEALTVCVPVQVSLLDGLPQQLCEECVKLLQIAYSFRDISIKTDETLRNISLSLNVNNLKGSLDQTSSALKIEPPEIPFKIETDSDNYDGCDFNADFEINEQQGKEVESNECVKRFKEEKKFLYHLTSHEDLFICSVCEKIFHSKKTLEMHIIVHDRKTKSFESKKCEKQINVMNSSKESVIGQSDVKEEQDNEDSEEFKCLECGAAFQRQKSLSSHMHKHNKIKDKCNSYKCDICDKEFSLMTLLKRHMKLHDSDKPFKCKQCPESYSRHDQLTIHENKHNGVKRNVCSHCNKAFSQLSNLKDHIRTHTGETPFLCSQCGRGFNNSSNLRQHMLRHTGLKPYACSLCPKTFSTKGQMTRHMSTHTGARPYKCDECGVSVTKPNSLKKHKLIHLGIRPFECDACPMRFTCKDHLKRHYRIHTGEKPYKCKFCDRAFTQSNDLAKHLRSHVGQNIYQCTVCDKRFRLLTELKQHYPTHYVNGEIPEEDKSSSSIQKQSIIIPADSNKPEISITFDRNLIDNTNGLPTSITIGICNDNS